MVKTDDVLEQMQISRADHLPVIAAFCRRVNLIEIINRVVPTEMDVSVGYYPGDRRKVWPQAATQRSHHGSFYRLRTQCRNSKTLSDRRTALNPGTNTFVQQLSRGTRSRNSIDREKTNSVSAATQKVSGTHHTHCPAFLLWPQIAGTQS